MQAWRDQGDHGEAARGRRSPPNMPVLIVLAGASMLIFVIALLERRECPRPHGCGARRGRRYARTAAKPSCAERLVARSRPRRPGGRRPCSPCGGAARVRAVAPSRPSRRTPARGGRGGAPPPTNMLASQVGASFLLAAPACRPRLQAPASCLRRCADDMRQGRDHESATRCGATTISPGRSLARSPRRPSVIQREIGEGGDGVACCGRPFAARPDQAERNPGAVAGLADARHRRAFRTAQQADGVMKFAEHRSVSACRR